MAKDTSLLETLHYIIKEELLSLYLTPEFRHEWNSLHVTYHPPRVERLWIQWGSNHRLFLHRIHPCEKGEALFHPHPWPSAVHIVRGRYEMGIAGTSIIDEPLIGEEGPAWDAEHARVILGSGSSYEMTEPQGWHYVRPLDAPVDSIMLTGAPYNPPVKMPQPPTTKQEPLSPERFEVLWDRFQNIARLAKSQLENQWIATKLQNALV